MLSRYTKWRVAKSSHAIRNRFKLALIEKVPLFAGLSAKEMNQIARSVNEIEVPPGTRLAAVGEAGNELFIIIDGEALVTTKPGRKAVLKAGDFFGEMSLIDGAPRSATVDATTPIRLLVLGQREFWRVLDETPSIVRKVMHTLCQRLREAEKPAFEIATKGRSNSA
jgi:CRP/FNR family cyclic AMP-dependent transcriptional regulator